ncbi:N-acetylmuramoyl-L-alanine amidase family protein [Seonamhaeicola aphaedonensis]|uniref:N-acetylmuramoyl-L-alanine amidase n=1 Tax=Seonamhaeicola aphaedonensis TaxID=1461338 RepID=A0A3D9HJS6_9FLAO|nr:N-acetylmuramoyl-L-alanine amidase [Seonamhaeicola aphaedonensis]RED49531.1 N-acetylmuramoyl-L-alanine amidase [Seonamhaeicola aphaedonensis]
MMQTYRLSLFVSIIIVLTLSYNTTANAQVSNNFVIMIDPGHGGKDSGTPGTGRYKTTEKDIALDVSLALGKMIQQKIPAVNVVYTRSNDIYPTLNGRTVLANKKDVDLFISIHCNAQPGKTGTAYGSETYVLGTTKNKQNLEVAKRENSVIALEDDTEVYKDFNPDSPESVLGLMIAQEAYLDHSIKLARYIEDEFQVTAKRKSRGVKQNIFYVLAYTYMPSVLVELGFLTHKKEEDFLNSKRGKELMTKSLFNAIEKYLQYLNVNTNDVVFVEDTTTEPPSKSIEFKVQIAASSKELETKPYNFKGLNNISSIREGSLFKYFYGNTSNYEATKQLEEEAKKKGYKSCFVVAFKDGKKIPLIDALKTISN